MTKEGEGVVGKNKTSSLQDATGQGKETGGIKYPYPAPHVLAFMEDQFGPLDQLGDIQAKRPYNFLVMLIFYLEMQKKKRLKEIVMMSEKEREVASVLLFEKEKIDIGKMNLYGQAAMEVFSNALGARRVKSR